MRQTFPNQMKDDLNFHMVWRNCH